MRVISPWLSVAIGSTVWSLEGECRSDCGGLTALETGRAPVVFASDLKNWRSIRGDTDTLKPVVRRVAITIGNQCIGGCATVRA
jgi:hypothetical protein